MSSDAKDEMLIERTTDFTSGILQLIYIKKYQIHSINIITFSVSLGALGGEWGYWHSADLAVISHGKGKIVLSTYRLADILHTDPTAGRILLNLIKWLYC